MAEENPQDIDAVDIASAIGALIGTASAFLSTGSLFFGLIYAGGYGIQHWIRRTAMAQRLAQRITDDYPKLDYIAPALLPGPKEQEQTEITLRQDKPIDVRIVDAYESEPFWKRVTQPLPGQTVATVTKQTRKPMMSQQESNLYKQLKRLPPYVHYQQLPKPPSRLSVPIGIEGIENHVVWGDFSSDGNLIHALVAGQTGSGKDALLRLWFATLTIQNTPQDLQFVILDGKIDWLSPALAESAFMAIKPAGGINIKKVNGKRQNVAIESMAQNLDWIFEEIDRRSELMKKWGAVDLASLERRSGMHLPYIFVLASDVSDTFNNDLQMLVESLIARGRSYGIRLIISLQNPVGESTRWRSQIGLVMSGYQMNPDHDRYIMGMNVDRMLIRPSQLPNPEESDISKGLFVVRHGGTQHLVRTAHMPEEDWYKYIENILPKKRDVEDTNLLSRLLLAPEEPPKNISSTQPKMRALTDKQIERIQELVFAGKNKTEIMLELGFSNGNVYREKSPAVSIIINATRRKLQ